MPTDMDIVLVNEAYHLMDEKELAQLIWKLFGPYGHNEGPLKIPVEHFDLYGLLVAMKVFPSKSQARKNFKHTVNPGWNDWTVGKMKKRICIWLPIASMTS